MLTADDLAVDRAVKIADRLDRFDLAERLAGLDLPAHRGQLDVDQVGEDFQGEGREPHDGDLADRRIGLNADPFVRLGVQTVGSHVCVLSAIRTC